MKICTFLLIASLFLTISLSAQIQEVNAQPYHSKAAKVVDSIPSPVNLVLDIAYVDGTILLGGWAEDYLYKISPKDGSVIEKIPHKEIDKPGGLATDGQTIFSTETDQNEIHRINIKSGIIYDTYETPRTINNYPAGLAWDGNYLWSIDTRNAERDSLIITKLTPSGEVIESFMIEGSHGGGLTYGNGSLWYSDNGLDKIFRIDLEEKKSYFLMDAPGGDYPNGMAFDGQYLWLANGDSDMLYKIKMDPNSELSELPTYEEPMLDDIIEVEVIEPLDIESYLEEIIEEEHTTEKESVTEVVERTEELRNIKIYPNPSSGTFIFETTYQEELEIRIYASSGQQIMHKETMFNGTCEINLKGFTPGVYFYIITGEDNFRESGKLILK